eukprot:10239286-Ditylum_brightwellii.AAC.1
MSPGISDAIKKKLSDHSDDTVGNEDMGNSKNEDTETEEDNDSVIPRITRRPEPPNQDGAYGNLNF